MRAVRANRCGRDLQASPTWLCVLALCACGGGTPATGNGDGGGACADLSGTWIVTHRIDARACGEGDIVREAPYTATQDGCSVVLVTFGGGPTRLTGAVAGSRAGLSGSLEVMGGTAAVQGLSISASADGRSFQGSGGWRWTGGSLSCSGTVSLSAALFAVASTTPPDGAQGVSVFETLDAAFTMEAFPMLGAGSFRLSANGQDVAGSSTWDAVARKLRFEPAAPLAPSTLHTATVAAQAAHAYGAPMAKDHTWTFTTGPMPVSDVWAAMSTSNAPGAREGHTAVWTGSHMIVWGGRGADLLAPPLATGGRYDPADDAWSPTSAADAPAGREGHVAVWTGSHMIVWGGRNNQAGFVSAGGRYHPATDTWSPMSTAGAPPWVSGPTAVWTGSEMIVWGDGGGGRYDPVSDSWRPVATAGAPSFRTGHAAVWTGSEMIVWGGLAGTFEDTGARYDPASDAWKPVARAGAPSARDDHAAVWTGTEMIVWGGRDASYGPVASGGRYDPAADAWRATSTAGAPPPSSRHGAVLAGADVIVYGEFTGPAALVRGGFRYRPAADAWSPIRTVGAPIRIQGFSLVWTGRDVLVWGGRDGSFQVSNGGGRYRPQE